MPSKTYKRLLETVNDAHDWDEGQMRGLGGTAMAGTDVCRICGLSRRRLSDSQNGIYRYTFVLHGGGEVTLRDVAAMEPCIEKEGEEV